MILGQSYKSLKLFAFPYIVEALWKYNSRILRSIISQFMKYFVRIWPKILGEFLYRKVFP